MGTVNLSIGARGIVTFIACQGFVTLLKFECSLVEIRN